jgi:hypothetical protein
MLRSTNPGLSTGGETHLISFTSKNSPLTTFEPNLHDIFSVFLKLDPVTITVVLPLVGPTLGSQSNT